MAQQFEQPSEMQPGSSPLRAQRMTADESRAVIDLWQSERVEQTGLTDKPAVPDVAEGLDITVEDVARLLQDVRAKRLEEERALAAEKEFAEIRLAEEERKLAEIQRQRAELRREQAEDEQEQSSRIARVPEQRQGSVVGAVFATVFIIIWLWIAIWMFNGDHTHGPFDAPPSTVDCTTTAPDGKPEPCSPEMKAFIENGINKQTHR